MDFAEECNVNDAKVHIIEFCGKRYKKNKGFWK